LGDREEAGVLGKGVNRGSMGEGEGRQRQVLQSQQPSLRSSMLSKVMGIV
jgi:hypothetical protein